MFCNNSTVISLKDNMDTIFGSRVDLRVLFPGRLAVGLKATVTSPCPARNPRDEVTRCPGSCRGFHLKVCPARDENTETLTVWKWYEHWIFCLCSLDSAAFGWKTLDKQITHWFSSAWLHVWLCWHSWALRVPWNAQGLPVGSTPRRRWKSWRAPPARMSWRRSRHVSRAMKLEPGMIHTTVAPIPFWRREPQQKHGVGRWEVLGGYEIVGNGWE